MVEDLGFTRDLSAGQAMYIRDLLMLAAWAVSESSNEGQGHNPIAFVQRAKQVIDWGEDRREGVTLLDHLEAKGRELARLLGERLAPHEGFVLTIFDQAAKGHSTWLTSLARRDAIKVLGDTLAGMKEDQAQTQ